MGGRIAVLNAGILQQVGTPLEVYEKPVNLFVANFIGTPPMNFIPATVADGGATLRAAKFTIPAPASCRSALAGRDGRGVMIGIRPEKVEIVRDAAAAGPGIVAATVEVVELLGNEAVFHGRVGDDLLVAKAESHHAPRVGDTVSLRLDLEALHLFDAETERRLP